MYRFRRYPEIKTLEQNEAFCKFVRGLLDEQYATVSSLPADF